MGKGMTAGKKIIKDEVKLFKYDPMSYILMGVAVILFMIMGIMGIIFITGVNKVDSQSTLPVSEQQQVVQQVKKVESSEEAETEAKVDYGVVENAMDIMNEPNEKSKLTDEDIEIVFYITYKQIKADSEAEQYETDLQNAKNVLREYSYEFPENFEEVYQNWRTNYINAGETVK